MQVLNVDGILQSGKDAFTVTLDSSLNAEINAIKQKGPGTYKIDSASTLDYTVSFDNITNHLIVTDLRIGGGSIDITGAVTNTANGQIKVLGGYGAITVNNSLPYAVEINNVDVSKRGAGTLTINDTSNILAGVSNKSVVTHYEVQPDGTLTKTVDSGGGPTVTNNVPMNQTYQPSDWRYAWTTGVDEGIHYSDRQVSSSWAGIIDLGTDHSAYHTTHVLGAPTVEGAGPYYYLAPNNDADYAYSQTTVPVSDHQSVQVQHTDTTWYGVTSVTVEFADDSVVRVLHTEDINAHRPIAVQFFGHTQGGITVNSDNGGSVYLESTILNPTGTTSITTNDTIIADANSLTGGQRVVPDRGERHRLGDRAGADPGGRRAAERHRQLRRRQAHDHAGKTTTTNWADIAVGSLISIDDAGGANSTTGAFYKITGVSETKIGNQFFQTLTVDPSVAMTTESNRSIVLVVNPTASLSATTTKGDISITQLAGNLPIDTVKSGSLGTINLTADGGIPVARSGANSFYQGLVSGGGINLVAENGGIGSSTTHPLVVDTPLAVNQKPQLQDKLNGSAHGNVFLQEKSGDLRIDTLTTTGDVWINVPDGSLIDANSNQIRDERTVAALEAGVWADLQLTTGTGYDQKVTDTINAYISAKTGDYNTYWAYRHAQPNGGTTFDINYIPTLSAAELAYYTNVLGYNAAAIQTLVNARSAEYHALNSVFGVGGSYLAQDPSLVPDTFNVSFKYLTTQAGKPMR